jgi:hypothetical protein
MRVLVVWESMFGNTKAIAEAIEAGLANGVKRPRSTPVSARRQYSPAGPPAGSPRSCAGAAGG